MKKLLTFVILIILMSASAASAQSELETGRNLFDRGRYQEAYASLWPYVQTGNPEAVFLALIIRRNGLDGRRAAEAAEMSALWKLLADGETLMRQGLRDRRLSADTLDVYRTALAQLEYFGPAAPVWPPVSSDNERAKRGGRAERTLGPAALRYPPAMNFIAFVYLELQSGSDVPAFRHTLSAAEKGDHLAMGNLAWMYRDGVGTAKNDIRAAHWARVGCDSIPPVPRNANEVGYVYESGRGVSQDQTEALAWYEKAAAGGHPAGRVNVQRLKSKSPAAPVLDNRILF